MVNFLASAMFGCHPVHVEAVLSVVGRADLLYSGLFLVSSLLLLLWTPATSSAKHLVLTLLTAVSMFCKEQGILFLVFWFLIELYKTGLVRRKVLGKKFVQFSIFIVCALAALVTVRMWIMNFEKPNFQKHDNPTAFQPSFVARVLNFNYIYLTNFAILLFPNWLCFDWAMGCLTLVTLHDTRIFILIAFWSILVLTAVKIINNFKTRKLEYFALCLLVTPFILSMNIFVYVGFVIAERNLYLSLAGMALLICKGFVRLQNNVKSKCNKLLLSCLMVLLLTSFVTKTYIRSLQWRNEIDLFKSGLNVCYNNAKVHYNVAKKLADQNQMTEAVILYKESLRLTPDYEHALNNLGNVLRMSGQHEEAEALLVTATRINPRFAAAFMNLAIVQQARAKHAQAEAHYLRALELRPLYPDCQFNLGNLYLKTRQLRRAEERFREASSHKHELAHVNLIILLDEQSRLAEAQQLTVEAMDLFPNNPEFYFQNANILGQLGSFEESEDYYLKAISMKNKALFWGNLGVLYHRWNKKDQAIAAYKNALLIDNNMPSAKVNLEKLLKSKS